jgi:hypothetical protein
MESLGVDLFAGAFRYLASASVAHEEAPDGGPTRGFSGSFGGNQDGWEATVTVDSQVSGLSHQGANLAS